MPTPTTTLLSEIEQKAIRATALPAFDRINLQGIRRVVAELLGLFGRNSFFSEYTVHDIRHLEKMLAICDWIIPPDTAEGMASADWLLIVLSIYFHDLGLVITEDEYVNRSSSNFPDFRQQLLASGDSHLEYATKIAELGEENAERFLYQEFVRKQHAHRIKAWIDGTPHLHFGAADSLVEEIQGLLGGLPPQFRRDLGLICESHHSSDLDDFGQYKLVQPYGDSEAETANLHYCALILRTADLLHITQDRAPSTLFKLINPKDPLSQKEWWKQNAVTRVKPKPVLDKEGMPNHSFPTDTIEVFAVFEEPIGFFGLTSYLNYAETQLRQSHAWALLAAAKGSPYKFPWKRIDDSKVEAKNFLKDSFEFTLDQEKVLDLLTGHTLYNDSSVVLRELIQNSIDAVRFYSHARGEQISATTPSIEVHLDTAKRTLTISDQGTGMTQSVIENHLLKVGSSRYQDAALKKQFPNFTSISRFGIGVLTAFMIADELEIVTVAEEEENVKQISCRGVHGKYLIRLIPKGDPAVPPRIRKHGTEVRLKLRASADMPDILEILRKWIVIPRCLLTAQIDKDEVHNIGFDRVGKALESEIQWKVTDVESFEGLENGTRRIVELSDGVIDLAVAVVWSKYFQNWAFATVGQSSRLPSFGICIEGVRVVFGTPGFREAFVPAIANVSGPLAPRTNVARSGLEESEGATAVMERIYALFASHVATEVREMMEKRGQSPHSAVAECKWLLQPFLRMLDGIRSQDREVVLKGFGQVPLHIVESSDRTRLASINELREASSFWTIDSPAMGAAGELVTKISEGHSATALLRSLNKDFYVPDGDILSNPGASLSAYSTFFGKEVDKIVLVRSQKSVWTRWSLAREQMRWELVSGRRLKRVFVQTGPVDTEGTDGLQVLVSHNDCFVFEGSALAELLMRLGADLHEEDGATFQFLGMIDRIATRPRSVEAFRRGLEANSPRQVNPFPYEEAFAIISEMPSNCVFRTADWNRSDEMFF